MDSAKMIQESFSASVRENRQVRIDADLVIVGGGMAGTCAAIAAAREGIQVVLVQDRPVLGGNASSEVRLWILGATSHMGNNNRWAREGGVIDELLVENLYRNKEGNPLILDSILLEKVTDEDNITLLLNTSAHYVEKSTDHTIQFVQAFCSQNSTTYKLHAPNFCDASGDGVVSFLSGAQFRMGAESRSEFGEKLAPDESAMELLGHSMYFYSKRHDEPVKYVAPKFASSTVHDLPRGKILNPRDHGCRLWWIEYGGTHDTVHETEEIKWELWRLIYGFWDHIKNSGEFDDVDNLTLEWVGTIPGKRESRRFVGDYILKQQDLVEQREFDDAVAFGGWAIDHHPAEGVYSEQPSCTQYHCKGVYQIPYRCFISKDIDNLFYAGRIISASHVAFGSSRVMATCGLGGQAVGMAAAICTERSLTPRGLIQAGRIPELQDRLNVLGQSIPGVPIEAQRSPMNAAVVTATSSLLLAEIPGGGEWLPLMHASAQVLPLVKDRNYTFSVPMRSKERTVVRCELRISDKARNYTPNITIDSVQVELEPGEQVVDIVFDERLPETQYAFVTLLANDAVEIACSERRITGVTSVFNQTNKAVSNNGKQVVEGDIGIDEFEFWTPTRQPHGNLIAMTIDPPLECFSESRILDGLTRPGITANAWVAALDDTSPALTIEWPKAQSIKRLILHFDTDFDHAMESSLMGHVERRVPNCVESYSVLTGDGEVLHEVTGNYQTINQITLPQVVLTKKLIIRIISRNQVAPASIFQVVCLSE